VNVCKVLWVERDRVFARSLARLLRRSAPPGVSFSFRVVETCRVDDLDPVDRLMVDPTRCAGGFELLARWRTRRTCPAIALAHHFTAMDCAKLAAAGATPMTRDGIFEACGVLAELLVGAVDAVQATEPRAVDPASSLYDRFVDEIEARRVRYGDAADELEVVALLRALAAERSIAQAARRLGMRRTTLQSKMQKLGLRAPSARARARARAAGRVPVTTRRPGVWRRVHAPGPALSASSTPPREPLCAVPSPRKPRLISNQLTEHSLVQNGMSKVVLTASPSKNWASMLPVTWTSSM
jgi:hypothetical protein